MAYRLLYLPGAEKDIHALPERIAQRVRHGLEQLAEKPRLGKPLHGELARFWLYVGDCRIVYKAGTKISSCSSSCWATAARSTSAPAAADPNNLIGPHGDALEGHFTPIIILLPACSPRRPP